MSFPFVPEGPYERLATAVVAVYCPRELGHRTKPTRKQRSECSAAPSSRTLCKNASANSSFTLQPTDAKLLKQDPLFMYLEQMKCLVSMSVFLGCLGLTEVAKIFPVDDPHIFKVLLHFVIHISVGEPSQSFLKFLFKDPNW